MSTKIYEGFQIPSDSTRALTTWVSSITDGVKALQRERMLKAYATLFTVLVDKSLVAQAKPTASPDAFSEQTPKWAIFDSVRARQRKMLETRRRDPEIDFEVRLVCRTHPKLGVVLGFVVSEFASEVHKLVVQAAPAIDYSYWNNVDRSEGVSDEEWDRRGDAWHDVLRSTSPKAFFFQFENEDVTELVRFEEVAPYLPSIEARANKFAVPQLFNTWIAENEVKMTNDASSSVATYLEYTDIIRENPQWMQRLQQLIVEIGKTLPSNEALAGMWDTPQQLLIAKDPY